MRDHFDKIAADYDREIPEHIRLHLLEKKTHRMGRALEGSIATGARGVDLGCGTGHHLRRMAEMGYRMTGLELSTGMAAETRKVTRGLEIEVETGSILEAPFSDGAFDFSYAINVLHHLPSQAAQRRALTEMARIVRPGGLVLLQDFNADSAVTRFFMDHVFPLTSEIDEGQEIWISPKWLSSDPIPSLRLREMTRFTFLPHLTPRLLFGGMAWVEGWMESLTGGRVGAHFLAVMERV